MVYSVLFPLHFIHAALFGLSNTAEGVFGKNVGNVGPALFIGYLLRTVLIYIGSFFLLVMVHAGFMWMTAHGNDQKLNRAKLKIQHAIVALIIILSAYAITTYTVNNLLSAVGSPGT